MDSGAKRGTEVGIVGRKATPFSRREDEGQAGTSARSHVRDLRPAAAVRGEEEEGERTRWGDEHDDDRDEQRIERGGVLGGRDDPAEWHLDRGRPTGERELLERGKVVGACDDRERLPVGLHHSDRGVR